MAKKPKRTKSTRTGQEGWIIDANTRVPKHVRHLFKGKKQLRKHQFVPLSKCPDPTSAKDLQHEWQKELENKIAGAIKPEITFSDCYNHYCENHQPHRVLKWVNKQIGSWPIDDDFAFKFEAWIDSEKHRKKLAHRYVDGKWIWMPGNVSLSARHIQNEIDYAKSALFSMCKNPDKLFRLSKNPIEDMDSGKKRARKRRIKDYEEYWLMYVIRKYYPWFVPAVEFAKKNPIRPQDQFSLTITKHLFWDEINKQWRISYVPQKTKDQVKDEIIAHPIVRVEQKPYFDNLHSAEDCDRIFVRPGWRHCHEDPSKLYPINYVHIWNMIRRKAEELAKANCKTDIERENIHMTDIKWYDWRHHAVRFLKKEGINTDEIMQIAGWATETMVREYDPGEDDPDVRIAERIRRLKVINGDLSLNATHKPDVECSNAQQVDADCYSWRCCIVQFLKKEGLSTDRIAQVTGWPAEVTTSRIGFSDVDPDARILGQIRSLKKPNMATSAKAA